MRSSGPPGLSGWIAVSLAASVVLACGGPPAGDSSSPRPSTAQGGSGPALFSERAAELGLDFVHFNGMTGELYYVETIGGGAALFDYDLDGDLDLYLTQGHLLGAGKTVADAVFPPPPGPLSDRLYRNELIAEPGAAPGALRFTDVTEASGVAAMTGYGMGVASGDYDNDGRPDLYVTNWGSSNRLLRNQGDGTFRDVTEEAGVGERRWSVAAVFFDYDRDGWLDLFVANYLDYSLAVHKECTNDLGLADYCGPVSYEPVSDVLFRNAGRGADGTVRFVDVTAATGLTHPPAAGLGAVAGDFNGDGWPDLYVSNDEHPNHLLVSRGAGGGPVTFEDQGLISGSAMNSAGEAEAGMGIGAADADGDGDRDLLVVHLRQETNTLYLNQGGGLFRDRTAESGLAAPSLPFTSFGAAFFDYDNDGRLDALVANGAIKGVRELVLAGDPYPLHQQNQLFHNLGGGAFEDVTARAGRAFELSEVSRGAAFGDLDDDGDTDVVVVNNAGPVRLLVNEVGQDRPWIGLRLVGAATPRDMLGARAELHRPRQVRWVATDGSYASAHDPRLLFGLGDGDGPGSIATVAVDVTWPDGSVETFDAPRGSYTTLRQGTGRPPKPR